MAYSEEQIGEALALLQANGGNVTWTREALSERWDEGPSGSTIRRWRDSDYPLSRARKQAVAESGEEKKAALEKSLRGLARGIIAEMAREDKLRAAGYRELATALGISMDKLQLLLGEATEISEQRGEAINFYQQIVSGE